MVKVNSVRGLWKGIDEEATDNETIFWCFKEAISLEDFESFCRGRGLILVGYTKEEDSVCETLSTHYKSERESLTYAHDPLSKTARIVYRKL